MLWSIKLNTHLEDLGLKSGITLYPFSNRTQSDISAQLVSTTTSKYKYLWHSKEKVCQCYCFHDERQKLVNILQSLK